jgi:hypothetical protein
MSRQVPSSVTSEPSFDVSHCSRQNRLYRNISSRLSSSSGASPPMQSPGAQSRAVNIHYSSRLLYHCRCLLIRPSESSYLIAENVVFLTIADKSYPRKLAFSYLDELSKEFATTYGPKVETVRKPYAFVGFGTSCQRHCPSLPLSSSINLRYLHVQNRSTLP